jgi:hypothetical protein
VIIAVPEILTLRVGALPISTVAVEAKCAVRKRIPDVAAEPSRLVIVVCQPRPRVFRQPPAGSRSLWMNS